MKKLLMVLVLIASTSQAEIYAWKDSKGTTHYTNSTVEIPARYRAKAKVLNLGPEQKDQAAGQPAPSPASTAVPASPGTGPQLQPIPSSPPVVVTPQPSQSGERRRGSRRPRSTTILESE